MMTDQLRTLPTFHPLVVNAKRLLCLSHDDVERTCPVIVLRALMDLSARHERELAEAYERGVRKSPVSGETARGEGEMEGAAS
jgi:hypothetical protein